MSGNDIATLFFFFATKLLTKAEEVSFCILVTCWQPGYRKMRRYTEILMFFCGLFLTIFLKSVFEIQYNVF